MLITRKNIIMLLVSVFSVVAIALGLLITEHSSVVATDIVSDVTCYVVNDWFSGS